MLQQQCKSRHTTYLLKWLYYGQVVGDYLLSTKNKFTKLVRLHNHEYEQPQRKYSDLCKWYTPLHFLLVFDGIKWYRPWSIWSGPTLTHAMLFMLPYARYYNPRLVYFLPHFWIPYLCFQRRFFRKFCSYVWLIFKSSL